VQESRDYIGHPLELTESAMEELEERTERKKANISVKK
jgi:hypothetical protein